MRKAITLISLVGLTSIALAATAHAQETPSLATTSPAPAPRRRLEVNLSFLPMSLGSLTLTQGGFKRTQDAEFAPGLALSGSFEVFGGVSVGLAVQGISNVRWKEDPNGAAIVTYQEYDGMLRLAYGYTLADAVTFYAEVLPGFSLVHPQNADNAMGFVIAAGGGAAIDLGDRAFVNLGIGYQVGFQKQPAADNNADASTKFVRVALGIGVRF